MRVLILSGAAAHPSVACDKLSIECDEGKVGMLTMKFERAFESLDHKSVSEERVGKGECLFIDADEIAEAADHARSVQRSRALDAAEIEREKSRAPFGAGLQP